MKSINLSSEEAAMLTSHYQKQYEATLEQLNHIIVVLDKLGAKPSSRLREPDLDLSALVGQEHRGPGRPKKASSTPIDAAASVVKRGPGRPPKPGGTVKRATGGKRGRPKKVSAAPADSIDSGVKRGPGRPPKPGGPVKQAKGGKRGRPKKVVSTSTPVSAEAAEAKPAQVVGTIQPQSARKGTPSKASNAKSVKPKKKSKKRSKKVTSKKSAKPSVASQKKKPGKQKVASAWPDFIEKKLGEGIPLSLNDFVSAAIREKNIPMAKEDSLTSKLRNELSTMRNQAQKIGAVPILGKKGQFFVLRSWIDDGGRLKKEFETKLVN